MYTIYEADINLSLWNALKDILNQKLKVPKSVVYTTIVQNCIQYMCMHSLCGEGYTRKTAMVVATVEGSWGQEQEKDISENLNTS